MLYSPHGKQRHHQQIRPRSLGSGHRRLLWSLGVDMDVRELLDTEQQRVEQRRANLVAWMRRHTDGENFILHIEIQNQNDQ